jgi:hypothetical protein
VGGKCDAINQKRVMPKTRDDRPGNAISDKAKRYRRLN